jgi:hypothetical protein
MYELWVKAAFHTQSFSLPLRCVHTSIIVCVHEAGISNVTQLQTEMFCPELIILLGNVSALSEQKQ